VVVSKIPSFAMHMVNQDPSKGDLFEQAEQVLRDPQVPNWGTRRRYCPFSTPVSTCSNWGDEQTNKWLDQLVQQEVVQLGDGGYVDNTGLVSLVADGQDEVVVIIDYQSGQIHSNYKMLFQGWQAPDNFKGLLSSYPIFASDQEDAQKRLDNFQAHNIPQRSKLRNIMFGTDHLITANQPVYGITAGKPVTLHTIMVESVLGAASFDFAGYGELATEVVGAITHESNREKVQTIVSWFGKADQHMDIPLV